MDSTANPSQRQFLEEIATQYGFTGDTRTVFLSRFDQVKDIVAMARQFIAKEMNT